MLAIPNWDAMFRTFSGPWPSLDKHSALTSYFRTIKHSKSSCRNVGYPSWQNLGSLEVLLAQPKSLKIDVKKIKYHHMKPGKKWEIVSHNLDLIITEKDTHSSETKAVHWFSVKTGVLQFRITAQDDTDLRQLNKAWIFYYSKNEGTKLILQKPYLCVADLSSL